jgi:flagellin
MAIRVNYNSMSVLTNANLAKNDRMLERVLDRLSSGERLRRSADDPAAMVVANSVRYHRTGVDRAQSNAEEAVTMLQTAEGAMDQISATLQRLRTMAIAASSNATVDADQLRALQTDLDSAVRSITTIAAGSTYGGVSLLDGSLRDLALSDTAKRAYRELRPDYTRLPGGIADGTQLAIGAASGVLDRTATVTAYTAGTPASDPAFSGSGTLAINGPLGSTTIALASGMTISGAVAAINASSAITGAIAAYDAATGDLRVESRNYGNAPLSLNSTIVGFLDGAVVPGTNKTITLDYTDRDGNPQSVLLEQDPTSADGLTFANLVGGPNGVPPDPAFTGFAPGAFSLVVRDPGDGGVGSTIAPATAGLTATRAGTTGFQIGALASQRVTVEIADLRAGALGHSADLATSGYDSLESLASGQALVNGDATHALAVIDAALAEVNRERGHAGALQGNTVERVMESLRVSSTNLRDFEGILRDVDVAAESAEFSRLQVMVQAATAMLAQANQVPQTVLQLLR